MFKKIKNVNVFVLAITVILLSLVVYLMYNSDYRREIFPLQSEAKDTAEKNNAIPYSNREWINMIAENTEVLKRWISTTTFAGKVVEISEDHGSENTGFKYYYVGKPGSYDYQGRVALKNSEGIVLNILFSPIRMEKMEVFEISNSISSPINFSVIQIGDNIEIEESVDLSLDNTNDQNLKSLIIRVIR